MFEARRIGRHVFITGLCLLWLVSGIPGNPAQENPRIVTDEFARDIALDVEGNVYITGYSRGGPTGADAMTLKYDGRGRLVWAARYDGSAHDSDYGHALAVDVRGRIWVTGASNGPGTSLDTVTLLYSPEGKLLRSARYDGPAGRDDQAELLVTDSQGGAAAAGNSFGMGTEHDYLVRRFDAAGQAVWTARYNSPRNRDDMAKALVLGRDGFVYVTGVDRFPKSNYDWATLKYSPQGERIWLARHTGPDDTFDAPEDMAVDARGGVYVTGTMTRGEEEFNYVTIKYHPSGTVEWSAEYDGPAGRLDWAQALALDGGGNVYVTGKSQGADTAMDIVTLKYDPAGELAWEHRFNGPAGGADIPCAIAVDKDSNILVAGTSRSPEGGRDLLLLKYDPEGRLIWEYRRDEGDDTASAMALDRDGGALIAGTSHGGESGYDVLILKIDAEGGLVWTARYDGSEPDVTRDEFPW